MRLVRHLFAPLVRTHFEAACMERIQAAIGESELTHRAEICFAVERALSLADLVARIDSRTRAATVFSQLRVWDTAANNGVLIYVLLAEHAIEILPDRDAKARIAADEWQRVCSLIAQGFAAGRHADAIIAGVEALTPLLARHYPLDGGAGGDRATDQDELPNMPRIL